MVLIQPIKSFQKFYLKDGSKTEVETRTEEEKDNGWIWVVIIVLICCGLAVIGVWFYLKKRI